MASPPAIAARNLTLTLGQGDSAVEVLRGISLEVPAGQVVALLGPSGSGKSSLMAVLSGLERASGGSLMVAGADFAGMDEDGLALARRGRIGMELDRVALAELVEGRPRQDEFARQVGPADRELEAHQAVVTDLEHAHEPAPRRARGRLARIPIVVGDVALAVIHGRACLRKSGLRASKYR